MKKNSDTSEHSAQPSSLPPASCRWGGVFVIADDARGDLLPIHVAPELGTYAYTEGWANAEVQLGRGPCVAGG